MYVLYTEYMLYDFLELTQIILLWLIPKKGEGNKNSAVYQLTGLVALYRQADGRWYVEKAHRPLFVMLPCFVLSKIFNSFFFRFFPVGFLGSKN